MKLIRTPIHAATDSLPGWAPSTFVSSRNDRAKAKVAKPEDYMDEEDLQEMKERMLVSGEQGNLAGAGPSAAQEGAEGFDNECVQLSLCM